MKIAAVLAMGKMAGRAARSVAASTAAFLAEQLHVQSKASALRAPLTYALGSTATPTGMQALFKIARDGSMTPYQVLDNLSILHAPMWYTHGAGYRRRENNSCGYYREHSQLFI